MVPMLVLLFVALWFILRGDLFYVLPCVILFLCFSVLLALRLSRLGKRELILVLFVRLFDLRLFGFVCFLFLLVSGKGCGLWLWHSLDFSLTLFYIMCFATNTMLLDAWSAGTTTNFSWFQLTQQQHLAHQIPIHVGETWFCWVLRHAVYQGHYRFNPFRCNYVLHHLA